jgi:hypothetical protein
MTVSDLIRDYSAQARSNSEAWRIRRDAEQPMKDARRAAILSRLRLHGAEIRWENGYVFKFVLDGRFYSMCDQATRVVGESWILQSEEDQEFLEHESPWCDDRARAIQIAVDYRSELSNVDMPHWNPNFNT